MNTDDIWTKAYLIMNQKWFWYSGITAVVVYLFAVILGGILYPGYSHISQDISQLTSTNSPIRDVMNIFFFYNILVAIFGLGLYQSYNKKLARIASLFVTSIGILGIIIGFFPINTRGTEISVVGVVHIVLVSIISLLTVTINFLFWVALKGTKFDFIATVSLWAGISFLITGPIAAFFVLSPYAGLLERIPIGIFLLWILTLSVYMLKKHSLEYKITH